MKQIKCLSIETILLLILFAGSVTTTSTMATEIEIPKGMTQYVPLEQKDVVLGEIRANGSTRVGPIVRSVLEAFTKLYPQVQFQVAEDGSGAAIPALLDKEINVALMSRRIKTEEINAFIDRRGYPPTELHIASDALRIIVNRHNPIDQLSLAELDAIFSKDRLCGAEYSLDVWEDFGWVVKTYAENSTFSPIDRHIWFEKAGPRDFIKNMVLCNGEFKDSSIESAHSTKEIIQEVAALDNAIGFAQLGTQNFDIKDLFITKERLHPGYKPTTENIISRKYPLSGYLYIYIDKPPTSDMPLLFKELFKFLFASQGQQIIVNHHAIPLSHQLIRDELTKLIKE